MLGLDGMGFSSLSNCSLTYDYYFRICSVIVMILFTEKGSILVQEDLR